MNTITPDNLACRHWRSEHIRSYVMVLAGAHLLLLLILDQETPLHTVEEDSPAGVLLWVAYNVVVGLPDVAGRALELAREKWPEETILFHWPEHV